MSSEANVYFSSLNGIRDKIKSQRTNYSLKIFSVLNILFISRKSNQSLSSVPLLLSPPIKQNQPMRIHNSLTLLFPQCIPPLSIKVN